MTDLHRIAKDEPERIVLSNIREFGWHAVNVIEDNGCPPWTLVRLAALFIHPCMRAATAAQRRDSGPPSGFLGEAPANPLSLPCDKETL
jgi:hypothetical protein